jgi:hypothetical protein
MQMNAKQRSAADHFAAKVNLLNAPLNDPSLVTSKVFSDWDVVIDELTALSEVDYANCNSDAQRMAVAAVLIAALELRARLRGTVSRPLSDMVDLLTNGAIGKPTRLNVPPKTSGAVKPINDAQNEVYYVVLYQHFPTRTKALNAAARACFGLTNDQLRHKRNDLKRQRALDPHLDRMFRLADDDVLEMGSHDLNDYI